MFSPPIVNGSGLHRGSYTTVLVKRNIKRREMITDLQYLHFTMAFKHGYSYANKHSTFGIYKWH